MYKCKSCGHQWTKGKRCPHCDSTEFEISEPIVETETPETVETKTPETDDSTETDEEE